MRSSRGRRSVSSSYRMGSRPGGRRPVSYSASLKNRARWFSVPGEVIPRRNAFVATLKQQARVAQRAPAPRVYYAGPSVVRSVKGVVRRPVRLASWFKRPDVCLARVVRRQVLFAKGIGGFRRSPGGSGGYRRTEKSSVRC